MTEDERRPPLEGLTLQTFAPLEGETFSMHVSDDLVLPVELVETRSLGTPPIGTRREGFTLVFRGPADPVAPQAIYRLENERLGEVEIFLVPIGPDEAGMRYEAVFN